MTLVRIGLSPVESATRAMRKGSMNFDPDELVAVPKNNWPFVKRGLV